MMPLDEIEQMEERHEFTARTFEELGYDRAAAYHNSESQALRMKKYYDDKKKTEGTYYEINDWVKLKFFGKTKFEFNWKGPYHIVGYGIAPSTYYIMDSNGRRLDNTVAQDNLAPWMVPLGSNQDYNYDPVVREIADPAPIPIGKSCEGRTEKYKRSKQKIGIPSRVPSNSN